jgi:L-methionine (R)-S-oxide reductase
VDEPLLARVREVVATPEPRAARAAHVVGLIRQGTGVRWVGVYTVDQDVVTNEAWSGPGAPSHPVFPASRGLTAHAVRTRAVAVSNDVANDPRYLTNQDDSGSELIVPLLRGERVVGTLDVESGDVGAFSGSVIHRFEVLAAAVRPLWD